MTPKKQGILLGVAGFMTFVGSVESLFLESPRPVTWVLLGPGLVGGPAMLWLAWRKLRESKSSDSPLPDFPETQI
jgi:divalent metal cation (Fe/Co/Zn/Cd) transporter